MPELQNPDSFPTVWPYPERSGVKAEQYFQEIIGGPEYDLTQEERLKAKQFAESLFEGDYSAEIKCASKNNLYDLYKSAPDNHILSFYPGYFETEAGMEALRTLGFETFDSYSSADIEFVKSHTQTADRKKIASDSRKWYLKQLASQLLNPPDEDVNYIDRRPVELNYEPRKLLEKLDGLQAYRQFFREVRRDIKNQPESGYRSAQDVLLAAYRGRVNDLLSRHYKDAISLAKQLSASPDNGSELMTELGEIMPVIKATFLQEREDNVYDLELLAGNFSRRLDFLRNGAAWSGVEDFTPISSELSVMADSLSLQDHPQHQPEIPIEIIEKFNRLEWDASQLKELAETVISEWGLLSGTQSSWLETEERDGPAEDKKWQVIVTPKSENMSVDGAKKIFNIPESYLRTTFNNYPAGAVPGIAHELMHLVQNEFAEKLAEQVPLAKIKGRHTNTNMELGTINQERIIQSKVGRDRPVNTNYLRSLSVKLRGGNRLQVARAFYDAYTEGQTLSEEENAKARLLAADRTNRFYTQGGHNSASLAYLEQELLRRKLENFPESDQQRILIMASVFDLPDLASLVKTGLVRFPRGMPTDVAEDVWRVFIRDYIKADNVS